MGLRHLHLNHLVDSRGRPARNRQAAFGRKPPISRIPSSLAATFRAALIVGSPRTIVTSPKQLFMKSGSGVPPLPHCVMSSPKTSALRSGFGLHEDFFRFRSQNLPDSLCRQALNRRHSALGAVFVRSCARPPPLFSRNTTTPRLSAQRFENAAVAPYSTRNNPLKPFPRRKEVHQPTVISQGSDK